MRELLRVAGMNAYDYLQEHFSTPLLTGALGFDAVLGSNLGPRSPGSMFTYLHRLAARSTSRAGDSYSESRQPLGGLGAVVSGARRCGNRRGRVDPHRSARGTDHRARAPRRRRAARLRRADRRATAVISNVDPQCTFLRLLGAEHLDAGFVRRMSHLRTRGVAAKLHLALETLPRFAGLAPRLLSGRLLISPSLEYLERAFNHSKYGEFSTAPALEVTLPTLNDPQLGACRATMFCRPSCSTRLMSCVRAGRRAGNGSPNPHRPPRCVRARIARFRRRLAAAGAPGYRARVSDHRRPLASRRARARSVLHVAPGAGCRAVRRHRWTVCICAVRVATRAAESWESPAAMRRAVCSRRRPDRGPTVTISVLCWKRRFTSAAAR